MNATADIGLDALDGHRVRAAEGWVELGLPTEADVELAGLSPDARAHPLALHAQWAIHAHRREWRFAHLVGEALVQAAPADLMGWVHRAYAARRMEGGGLQAAWDALRPAAELFPDETIVPYNLACYACQTGNLDAARHWLGRARTHAGKHGGGELLKQMALADADLAPLHEQIAAWRTS